MSYSLKVSIVIIFYFNSLGTGMPIQAAADKIRKEIAEFGLPPKFPEKSNKVY